MRPIDRKMSRQRYGSKIFGETAVVVVLGAFPSSGRSQLVEAQCSEFAKASFN